MRFKDIARNMASESAIGCVASRLVRPDSLCSGRAAAFCWRCAFPGEATEIAIAPEMGRFYPEK